MNGPKYMTGIRQIVVPQEMAARINEPGNLLFIMTPSFSNVKRTNPCHYLSRLRAESYFDTKTDGCMIHGSRVERLRTRNQQTGGIPHHLFACPGFTAQVFWESAKHQDHGDHLL